MYTIKGPITFKKGETPKAVLDVIDVIKLPFTATNLTYTNKALDGKKFKYDDNKVVSLSGGKAKGVK